MKPLFALGATLLVAGCTLDSYSIIAVSHDGGIAFEARDRGVWPIGGGKVEDAIDMLRVHHRGGTIWQIERLPDPRCRRSGEGSTFPIVYSRVPDCFVQRVAPAPLRPGVLYRVESDRAMLDLGGDEGFFEVALEPLNRGRDPAWEEAEDWRNAFGPVDPENAIAPDDAAEPANPIDVGNVLDSIREPR